MVTAGLVFVVAVALAFDFFNGFHDAANSIATVVSTRVLTPRIAVMWGFHRYRRVDRLNRGFRRMQLVSAAAFSLGHGANDAQKTMGVILAVLIATRIVPTTASVPLWVVLSAHTAIGLGTLSGGWRIVHTMGSRITKLQPVG